MIEAARTVKHHWDGVLCWFDSKITNGLIEGINSVVQDARAKARGYRSIDCQPETVSTDVEQRRTKITRPNISIMHIMALELIEGIRQV